MRSAEIDELDLVVARSTAGDVYVLDGICTHGHAHLAHGALIDACIECPKHNGRFDLATGAPLRRPVRVPLGTYDVVVSNGRIITTLALQRPRDAHGTDGHETGGSRGAAPT